MSPERSPPHVARDREAVIDAFLAQAGLAGAKCQPLAGDASTRRYVRLVRPGAADLLLMDAPPSAESAPCRPGATQAERRAAGYNATARLSACRVDAFAAIAGWLRGLGLSAPGVLAFDTARGLALVEDLGEALFARRLEAGAEPGPLYEAATDVLVRLHAEPPPAVMALPDGSGWPLLAYDDLALATGADLFLQWRPRLEGASGFDAAAAQEWEALWAPLRARVAAGAAAFAHRDYHVENLLWLEQRSGLARVGLLDFQDAVRAHPAWDLASLLQDARRDVDPALEAAMVERYLERAGVVDPAAFRADYAVLAALNNLRIIGVFARLASRDGKARYLAFLPRLRRLVARDLAHPDLAGVRGWMARHSPGDLGG